MVINFKQIFINQYCIFSKKDLLINFNKPKQKHMFLMQK